MTFYDCILRRFYVGYFNSWPWPLLERLRLGEFFTAVYGAGRKSYTKPDPRIFHDVARDLHDGRQGPAVMIGDSITDLSTARAAGAPCILMSYGYTPVPAAEL